MMAERTTEQDRLRQVIESRKTMRKFAKVAWMAGLVVTIGACGIVGLTIGFGLIWIIITTMLLALEVGAGAFLRYSFNHSDMMDKKRIAELDANPGKGQGLGVKKKLGQLGDLSQEVNAALTALAASAAKMPERREQVDEAIGKLREQSAAISKALATISQALSQEDEAKLAAEEAALNAELASGSGNKSVLETRLSSVQNRQKNMAELKEQETNYLDQLKLIRDEAKDLKLGLEKALADESGDSEALNAAIRSIKVETATTAQMKALNRNLEHA